METTVKVIITTEVWVGDQKVDNIEVSIGKVVINEVIIPHIIVIEE